MTDVLNSEQRHRNMSNIKGKNTKPEIILRKIVFSLGYRYRLYSSLLPGKPDLVFPRKKKVIFLHGCYWHSHDCKYGLVSPKINAEFWANKRSKTVIRDLKNILDLSTLGWKSLVIWECELKDKNLLIEKIIFFLT